MNFTTALLTPFLLLLHGIGHDSASEPVANDPIAASVQSDPDAEFAFISPETLPLESAPDWDEAFSARDFLPVSARQVSIEQRVIIRITPRAPGRATADMFSGMPSEPVTMHFSERKIGKCLPISSIAGVQPDRANRLFLYTRDRRIIGAELEQTCRARDFYSGFYIANSDDGRLCIDRDELQSRSGANCKLTRIRQLIPDD